MAWSAPKTWSSEPLTSTDMNTYIRDNQNYLYNRLENTSKYELDEGSDYTTTSTSFVDVDGSNLALSLTTTGGDVLVGFIGTVKHDTNNGAIFCNISVDGVDYFSNDGLFFNRNLDLGDYRTFSFVVRITGLANGAHTFKLRWKTSTGTATLYAGAGTSGADIHPQFWVQEI